MPSKSTGRPIGRATKEIDWVEVEFMMLAQSTGIEIAGAFGVHPDTFYQRFQRQYGIRFTDAITSKIDGGKAKLRSTQFKNAMRGNTQLLLRLGDVWLGQDKKMDVTPNDSNIDLLLQALQENKELKQKLANHESYESKIVIDELPNNDIDYAFDAIQHAGSAGAPD